MAQDLKQTMISSKEWIFQIILHILVFVFYSFDKRNPGIEVYQIAFFLNYAIAALVINYFVLPRFFYSKKYIQFFIAVLIVVTGAILVEEFILEQIYFSGTRKAQYFQGFFFTLLDVLPVIVILSGFKFAWDALIKQREVDALKNTIKENELDFLKSQINPHFLFNNLNNLYAYAIEKSPKTPEIILELSGVLRYMLYECREKYVPLGKEVTQLENFIKLNEMQIEERGEVNFSSRNIQNTYQIAPLILIVFIENAFKHSTASQSDKIKIDVAVEVLEKGRLSFICKNSFHAQSNTDSLATGIGLANVRKRLALTYPNAHELNIKKSESLYEIQLFIDLNKLA